jgi:hypothetical protein
MFTLNTVFMHKSYLVCTILSMRWMELTKLSHQILERRVSEAHMATFSDQTRDRMYKLPRKGIIQPCLFFS